MARRLPCCVPCSSVVHVSSGVRAHTRSAGAELVAAAIVVPLAFFPLWECRVFAHVTLPQPKRLLLRLVLLPLGLLLGAHARLVLRLLALDDEQHDLKHAGWGCMLRTAQSLLATSLGRVGVVVYVHPAHTSLPPFPPTTPATFAAHARLLSWFLDAPAAPFGVHRMALAGKAAGKDVGMWFGPSAAGAPPSVTPCYTYIYAAVRPSTPSATPPPSLHPSSHPPPSHHPLASPASPHRLGGGVLARRRRRCDDRTSPAFPLSFLIVRPRRLPSHLPPYTHPPLLLLLPPRAGRGELARRGIHFSSLHPPHSFTTHPRPRPPYPCLHTHPPLLLLPPPRLLALSVATAAPRASSSW
ncbi:peptidase family C54-domain-containing protein [Mycena galericulata]|nr:peptidase family C54-domain-containing protein [Mycena galericulata]